MRLPLADERAFNRRAEILPDLPDYIDIECAFGCNLRCTMCPLGDRPANLPGRPACLMSEDLFARVLEQISARPRIVHLNIMGEPLLNPRLPEFVRAAKRRGHCVVFNTNGALMDDGLALRLVRAGVDRVCFSLDGFEKATYESLRLGATREHVFANVRNFARRNRGRGITMIKFLVSDRTEAERDRFLAHFGPLVDEVEFAPLDDWGGQLALPGELGARRWTGATGGRYPCLLLWNRASVAADGQALLCCHDYRKASNLPNVRDAPLSEIWNGAVRSFRADHASGRYALAPCARCDEWRRMPERIALLSPDHAFERLRWWRPRVYGVLRGAKRAAKCVGHLLGMLR